MKIHEIAQTRFVSEGVIEPNVMLSVANIIRRGRADNHFEFMVVARLIQFLKMGEFYKTSNPIFDSNVSTSKEVIDMLRALPPEQMTAIATHLYGLLQTKDRDALYALRNPTQEYTEYLQWLHSREADD